MGNYMTLRNDLSHAMLCGESTGEAVLTVVFREFNEESQTYYVAECLEIPGCISQGDTVEDAAANIENAIQMCLSVIYKDCLTRLMACKSNPDLRGISSQRRMTIAQPQPQLAYA